MAKLGMKPKVKKYQCVALESSSGHVTHVLDPNLTLAGEKIPFVGRNPVCFLGGTVQFPIPTLTLACQEGHPAEVNHSPFPRICQQSPVYT